MHATQHPDEELCELCWNDHTAVFRDDDGRPVCGTHANALEDGSWDGTHHEVEPLTYDDETPTEHEYVFVYGTLMDDTGYGATLEGFRKDTSGRYPTLIPNPDGSVSGEIHKVTEARLSQLDTYEGVPRLYKRVEAPMGVHVYIGDPDLLGSHASLTFDEEHLQECMDEAALTLAADFDPRLMQVEGV